MENIRTNIVTEIRVKFNGTHYRGKSCLCDLDAPERYRYHVQQEVSLFVYKNVEEGIHCFQLLDEHKDLTRCKFHYLARRENLIDDVVVITEPLNSIKDWINTINAEKRQMYERKDRANFGLGRGDVSYLTSGDFRDKFRPIIMFLHNLHGRTNYHGNLEDGTFLRSDETVCFSNFGGLLSFWDGVRKDFDDLVKLIEEACDSAHFMPCEWEDFKSQVANFPKGDREHELRSACWFLYHHPLFCSAAQTVLFIENLSEFSRKHGDTFKKYFKLDHPDIPSCDIGDWWNGLPPRGSHRFSKFFYEIFYYKSPDPSVSSRSSGPSAPSASSAPPSGGSSPFDKDKLSIITYIRNCLQHSYGEKSKTIECFKMVWPLAILVIYRETQDYSGKKK